MTPLNCPKCLNPWDGSSCAACGYRADLARLTSSAGPLPPVRVPSLAPIARPSPSLGTTTRPAPRSQLAHLADGPAAVVAAVVVGFLLSFGLVAAVAWPRYDPADLLAARRFQDVLTVVNASSSPSAEWQMQKGHALHELREFDAMLQAYQVAAAGDAVDEKALQFTLDALGVEATSERAATLLLQWPDEDEVDDAIVAVAGDADWRRRHRATEVLRQRPSTSSNHKVQALVAAAVADVRSDVCEHKLAGIKELITLADDEQAWPWLKKSGAWTAVYGLNAAVLLQHRCLNEELIRRADKVLAKVERD
jgi:hypothetical protein